MKKKTIIYFICISLILFSNIVVCQNKTGAKISKGNVKYIKILNKRTIKLEWKKINKVKKYQVQYSRSKKMKNSIIKTVKKRNNCKISNLEKGKKYFFRIRGIRGRMKGRWSKINAIKLDSNNIDIIKLINSKYNLKLPLNAKILNYTNIEDNYEFDRRKFKVCRIFAKIKLSDSEFKYTDSIIKKSKNMSYSIYEVAEKEIKWWNIKKKNIIKGQDFFNTIRVYENKQDNEGVAVRGHMEVYVTKGVKKGHKMIYICYEGG